MPRRYGYACPDGQARVAYEKGEDERALERVLQSFQRMPTAAATLDGLSFSAVDTAMMLRTRFAEQKNEALVARVDAALGELPPAMLEMPEFERESGRPARWRRQPAAATPEVGRRDRMRCDGTALSNATQFSEPARM